MNTINLSQKQIKDIITSNIKIVQKHYIADRCYNCGKIFIGLKDVTLIQCPNCKFLQEYGYGGGID